MDYKVKRNLEDIKVGDLVLIGGVGLSKDNLLKARIETVSKITPSGQFRLKDDSMKFDKAGVEIIPNKSERYNIGYSYSYIYKLTQELYDLRNKQFEEYKIIKKAKGIMKNLSLDYDNALKIIQMFDAEETE